MSGLVGANWTLTVMISITSAVLCLPVRRRQSSSLPIGDVAGEMNGRSPLQFCDVISLSGIGLPRSSGVPPNIEKLAQLLRRKFVQLDLLFYFLLPTTPISEWLSQKLNWHRYNDLQYFHHLERYKDSEVPA